MTDWREDLFRRYCERHREVRQPIAMSIESDIIDGDVLLGFRPTVTEDGPAVQAWLKSDKSEPPPNGIRMDPIIDTEEMQRERLAWILSLGGDQE